MKMSLISPLQASSLAEECGLPPIVCGINFALIEDDGTAVSFVSIREAYKVVAFGTVPSYRQQGYARVLFDMLTELYGRLSVDVEQGSAAALATILGAGFLPYHDSIYEWKGWSQ